MELNKINEVSNKIIEKKPVLEKIKNNNINNNSSSNAKEKQVNSKDLGSAVDKANEVLVKYSHLQFRIHEKTNEVMVKIVDDKSGEVLKEIPPEKMLDLVAKLWEIAGILIDEKR